MKDRVELLAPAGTEEALVAAVENGADAVYLGGALFSARAAAGNFTKERLPLAVDYVHHRGAKIYVTVNTLVKDGEMRELADWLGFLEVCGVDGVIIQDLGVLGVLREHFPRLEVHASTQMTVNNEPGIRFLSSRGVSRVVLARENTLQDIRVLAETGMELEVFIHGALCVCYSGQCLMSSMIGGRSGNRGRCAQPCRMTYDLVNDRGESLARDEGKHLLSPKDLNAFPLIGDLLDAGAVSLKIEGRMKRPEYVATVVRNYREAIDCWLDGRPETDRQEADRQLSQIFSREFTTGFFLPEPVGERMSARRPNNRGILLGRIEESTGQGFKVQLQTPLFRGDGLEIWVSKGGRKALTVDRMLLDGQAVEKASIGDQVEVFFSGRTFPGDRIFKTHDAPLIGQARSSYEEISLERQILVDIVLRGHQGEPLEMQIRDGDGHVVQTQTTQVLEEARNRPLTREVALSKMRLGGSGYVLRDFRFEVDEGLMIPMSVLNGLRREAVEELDRLWGAVQRSSAPVVLRDVPPNGPAGHLRLSVEVDTPQDARIALEEGADRVYIHLHPLRGNRWDGESVVHGDNQEVFYIIPRIVRRQDTAGVMEEIRSASPGADGFCAGTVGGLQMALDAGAHLQVAGDWSLNVLNSRSARLLSGLGLSTVCLSPELTLQEVEAMGGARLEMVVGGNLPLMVTEACLARVLLDDGLGPACSVPCRKETLFLRDRYDYRFPLRFDGDCLMHLFNSRELCLVEDLERIRQSGVSMVRLLARERRAQDIRRMVRVYRRLLDLPQRAERDLVEARQVLEQSSPYGMTKGHAYRGVE